MKRKTLAVVAVSALLAMGVTVMTGCGDNGEQPVVTTKYEVTVNAPTGVTVSGISSEGYASGDTVSFTVTVTDSSKVLDAVKKDGVALTPKSGNTYEFVMGEANVTIEVTLKTAAATLTVDKSEVTLSEIGQTATVNATYTNGTGTLTWSATDEDSISLDVSEDGKVCTITNVSGGETVIVTVTDGTLSQDVTVRASSYGDTRKVYSIYNASSEVVVDDIKGLYKAIGYVNDLGTPTADGYYITEKGASEKLYEYSNSFLSAMGKYGPTTELASNSHWTNGQKSPGWYSNYQLDVDLLTQTSTFNTLTEGGNKHAKYNVFDSRPVNFDASNFLDKIDGIYNRGAYSVWYGLRQAGYTATVTNTEYISWADSGKWTDWHLTFDLSDSVMTPSYNEDQGVFGQIYVGSSNLIAAVAGVYFDAGTMEENKNLEDGATRDIYTFTEKLDISGGLGTGKWGAREIGDVSIGKAVWDSFNKVWEFPNVSIDITANFYWTGEDPNNAEEVYHRVYEITGLDADGEVASVTYDLKHTGQQVRAGAQERALYGVTFTPEYDLNELPDITCGAKWMGVRLDEAYANNKDSEEVQNLQLVAGRTVNSGHTTGVIGADCGSFHANGDGETIYDFYY